MDVGKRSGQIPPFGNWDYANDLPITQYFESARQAGLIRFSSASGEFDHSLTSAPHHNRPPPTHYQETGRGRRCGCGKEQRKQGRVCDVAGPPRKQAAAAAAKQRSKQQPPPPPPPTKAARPPKAVDEDLYKIPPDLLHSSKRKKPWGIFSRCLVPDCMV